MLRRDFLKSIIGSVAVVARLIPQKASGNGYARTGDPASQSWTPVKVLGVAPPPKTVKEEMAERGGERVILKFMSREQAHYYGVGPAFQSVYSREIRPPTDGIKQVWMNDTQIS